MKTDSKASSQSFRALDNTLGHPFWIQEGDGRQKIWCYTEICEQSGINRLHLVPPRAGQLHTRIHAQSCVLGLHSLNGTQRCFLDAEAGPGVMLLDLRGISIGKPRSRSADEEWAGAPGFTRNPGTLPALVDIPIMLFFFFQKLMSFLKARKSKRSCKGDRTAAYTPVTHQVVSRHTRHRPRFSETLMGHFSNIHL